jgi:oxygen-independent coproporphyrinogen-3 oxidase
VHNTRPKSSVTLHSIDDLAPEPVLDTSSACTGRSEFHFTSLPPLSLYVHIPWCVRKCPYCDFNSHAVHQPIPEREYLHALLIDLHAELPAVEGRSIDTVFIGGGTPSLLSPETLNRLLCAIRSAVEFHPHTEITLESNPGTFEEAKFQEFRALGINRLSIGVQSFNDRLLQKIGRIHDGKTAIRAAETAHRVGFDNFNIDLMFGLPGQTKITSQADLAMAVQLNPSHISYYQLTIEPDTVFHTHPPTLPKEESLWTMQLQGEHILANHGYTQYEVSAYARPHRQCRHNMNYWEFADYLGIGAGAHGKITCCDAPFILRRDKLKQPRRYMEAAARGARLGNEQVLGPGDALVEFMLSALRLRTGFELSLFEARTGLPAETLAPGLAQAEERGLVNISGRHVAPTPLGRRFLNELILLFMHDP